MKLLTLVYFCLLSLMLFFSAGFVNLREKTTTVSALNSVESGDVVFRLGHGFISESMRKFSLKDPRYSHAGIISIENGKPVVYHLLGGESSVSILQKESLEKFCSRNEAASFAIYRTTLSQVQKNSVDSLNRFYFHTGLKYDNQFDLTTDSAMYCTEYVYKILSKVSEKKFLVSTSMLSGRAYIACDNIYLNPSMHKLFSISYE